MAPTARPRQDSWLIGAQRTAARLATRWAELEQAVRDPYPVQQHEIRGPRNTTHVPLNLGAVAIIDRWGTTAVDLAWLVSDTGRVAFPRATPIAVKWEWIGHHLGDVPADPHGHRIARQLATALARVETFLGYQAPLRRMGAQCPACGNASLVADLERWVVTCSYPPCRDETTGTRYRQPIPTEPAPAYTTQTEGTPA